MSKYNAKTFRDNMARAFDEADKEEVLIERFVLGSRPINKKPKIKTYSLKRKNGNKTLPRRHSI